MSFIGKVMEMPWLQPGMPEGAEQPAFSSEPDQRVALRVFLAVVTSMFFLFILAYRLRMELADWNPVAEPGVLWFNTGVLILGSVAMQRARNALGQGGTALKNALLLSGLLTVAFLGGQFMAWQELQAAGVFVRGNPAAAFFYLLTAVHGLHMLGGLYVLARTMSRVWRGASAEDVRLSVELCSVYWHFLLLVWLVLFTLMLNT